MDNRRTFLVKGMAAAMALSLGPSACSSLASKGTMKTLKTSTPRKAFVLWFSQTGYTERYGRLIARRLEMAGLTVASEDMRRVKPTLLSDYDLIVIGSPVQYYDVPPNVKQWLDGIPAIDGTAVAVYVSFGGPEGNQYNAACSLLERTAKRGGVPVGIEAFMNIGTFPFPDWKGVGIQDHMHLPDEGTYNQVRTFTTAIIDRIRKNIPVSYSRKATLRESMTFLPLIGLTKWRVGKHALNRSKCIRCGTCVSKCPTEAIRLSEGIIDRDRCIACFGCLNNCPTGAMEMEMGGMPLYGFHQFKVQQKITITEPMEIRKHS